MTKYSSDTKNSNEDLTSCLTNKPCKISQRKDSTFPQPLQGNNQYKAKSTPIKISGGAAAVAILHGGPLAPVILAAVVGIGVYNAFQADSDKPKY
jgi:hypothetical protein